MEYCDKISYRYYELENPVLVIYNYVNEATYYYDSISAELLNAILTRNEIAMNRIIGENELDAETVEDFINETNVLLNVSQMKTNMNECFEMEIIDNGETISQICNEMYRNSILYRFHIDITGKCNYRCVHCYHTFEKYSEDLLSETNIEALFEKLYKLGVFILTISGGEPFIRKDMLKILECAKKYDFVIQILTNGYFLNEKMIQEIANSNVCKLSFSYYGSENTHNKITNKKDSYIKLMNAIDLCIKYNISYELKFILLNDNVDEFNEYVNLCNRLGLRVLFEPCLIPKLDGDNSNFHHKLGFEKYKEFMYSHMQYFYNGTDITLYSDKCINCSAGKYGLYCDHTGKIYPCVSYREYLGEWKDVKKIWNESERLKEIRDRKHEQFLSFNKYSFCKYCYQICPGLSLCENGNSLECNNSGCLVAQVIESVDNEVN